MISRDSSSISQLLANARFEAHPALWYLCLFALSRFTHAPEAMQVLNLLIGAGAVLLLARFSPFTSLQKILFAFGYFPFFEYGAISRDYQLGNLFLFGFCTLMSISPSPLPLVVSPAWLARQYFRLRRVDSGVARSRTLLALLLYEVGAANSGGGAIWSTPHIDNPLNWRKFSIVRLRKHRSAKQPEVPCAQSVQPRAIYLEFTSRMQGSFKEQRCFFFCLVFHPIRCLRKGFQQR